MTIWRSLVGESDSNEEVGSDVDLDIMVEEGIGEIAVRQHFH